MLPTVVTVLLSFSFSSSSFYQIFTSASYLLSDLYSPDDVHALPAINPTDQQLADDNEDVTHEKNSSSDCADENEADTAMALKVRGTEIFIRVGFTAVFELSQRLRHFFKFVPGFASSVRTEQGLAKKHKLIFTWTGN